MEEACDPMGSASMTATAQFAGSTATATTRPRRRRPMPILWFVPVLALLGLVTLYPTAFVFWMSFQKTSYFQLQGFVGLSNYVEILGSGSFWDMAQISLIYLGGSLALSLAFGLAAALVFNASGRTGAALRVLTLFPWTLSMAVVGSIWL